MPTCNLTFRSTCGLFMTKRAKRKRAFLNCYIRLVPVHGVTTTQVNCIDLSVCDSLFFMKYVVYEKDCISAMKKSRFGMATVCFTIYLTTFLLSCGDVEANPGPREQNCVYGNQQPYFSNNNQGWYNSGNSDYSQLSRMHSEMSVTLNNAIERIEAENRRQGRAINQRLESVENKIDRRLHEMEMRQERTVHDLERVQQLCTKLSEENQFLREDVNQLSRQADYLDNQNRQHNLLFFGLTSGRVGYESAEECERKVRSLFQYGMNIQEAITFEHAFRSGKAIVVKFRSYKDKMFILSKSPKLKDSANFCNVFIRQDFSKSVQQKRRALLPIQKSARARGINAVFRYDKLVTSDTVFTYDLSSEKVIKQKNAHRNRNFLPATYSIPDWTSSQEHKKRGEHTGTRMSSTREPASYSSTQHRPPTNERDIYHTRSNTSLNSSMHDQHLTDPKSTMVIDSSMQQKPMSPTSSVTSAAQSLASDDEDPVNISATGIQKQHRSVGYNLRKRADIVPERKDVQQKEECNDKERSQRSKDRVTRKSTAARSTHASTIPGRQTPRGFGRGRARTPPSSQARIDSIFQISQASQASYVDQNQSPTPRDAEEEELHENRLDNEQYIDATQSDF